MIPVGLLSVVIGVFLLVQAASTAERHAPKIETITMDVGEVSALIERLKPLAKHPNDDWGGVSVKFTGASVTIELHTKDGNQYTGKGRTLRDAATMIDSAKIREALAGWDTH